ncbi:MAG TPA: CocE/NonD family hydrolase [Solirubrobacteraceae bacterium]|nr:CocE/NonD family hydrolase [Solirubrobacteraceae bacterium]
MTATVQRLPRETEVREDWIELSDGCRLYARTVLPRDAATDPVPAVLEYLPYRLSDGTAHRDATQHPYFAGHGYAGVRVDIRGTGNSDGILLDEYLASEQDDACEVIAWLAEQPWCSGRVGMYGKSWGGFNGLQVAARRPPALHAVISAYFTDDRYADDVHYMGGCVLGVEGISWASYMLGLNALPPDPEIVGERWRELWLERLERTPFFQEAWLTHQRRDDFWRQGSICEDFAAVRAPVLLIGGWADGYTNPVDRTLAGLTGAGVPCRALLGPWSHAWPEVSDPGPRIGFLQECLRWWDHWLRDVRNGAMDGPLLRAWMQEYDPPRAHMTDRRGRWVSEGRWPREEVPVQVMYARGDGTLSEERGPAREVEHVGSELAGADAGAWCPYGEPVDFPPDQRAEDGLAVSFTSGPLAERTEILGRPIVRLQLSVDRPQALVALRLCDVAPDGSSLLIARALLNLTHRDSHTEPTPVPVGAPLSVEVPLDFAGHAFAPGHRIRLAVSGTYWPYAWPSPQPVRLRIATGGATRLTLPAREPDGDGEAIDVDFGPPEETPAASGFVRGRTWRTLRRDLAPQTQTLEVGACERNRLDRTELEFGEHRRRRYFITEGDPLSARVECDGEHFLTRGDWHIRIALRTSMTSTADSFTVTHDLDAYEGDTRVHATRRSVEIPRDQV